ncbi:hypothetical protein PInf_021016 [Phytophthora infestans]|nr:hypothetical protein PInf_021016 [Phytophthora infestans]
MSCLGMREYRDALRVLNTSEEFPPELDQPPLASDEFPTESDEYPIEFEPLELEEVSATLPEPMTVTDEPPANPILPSTECSKKLAAFQGKNNGLGEVDVLLEVPSIGVFTAGALTTMRNYHRAMDAIAEIDKATVWATTIDFGTEIARGFMWKKINDCWMAKKTRLESNEILSDGKILANLP